MDTSFQDIDVPPYGKELYASECVHHVSEQVFRMRDTRLDFKLAKQPNAGGPAAAREEHSRRQLEGHAIAPSDAARACWQAP